MIRCTLALFAMQVALLRPSAVAGSGKQFFGETYKNTGLDSSLVYKTVEAATLLRCFDHCSFKEDGCRFVSYDMDTLQCGLVKDGPLSDLPKSEIISAPKQNSYTGRLLPYYGGIPHDCGDINSAEPYHLILPRGHSKPVLVMCDNGWTVIQRRINGSLDFNRTWADYKQGFGNLKGEFWLGNDVIHKLTVDGGYQLSYTLGMWNDVSNTAVATKFQVMGESTNYTLDYVDFMSTASVLKFSTWDVDNDDVVDGNCASRNQGAWWYDTCSFLNPNAFYPKDANTCENPYDTGNKEYCMKLNTYALLKQTTLKIKKV